MLCRLSCSSSTSTAVLLQVVQVLLQVILILLQVVLVLLQVILVLLQVVLFHRFEVNAASLFVVPGIKVMGKCRVTRRYNSTALNQRFK
jgi:hypothetical protein